MDGVMDQKLRPIKTRTDTAMQKFEKEICTGIPAKYKFVRLKKEWFLYCRRWHRIEQPGDILPFSQRMQSNQ